jgi:hypothetical protein
MLRCDAVALREGDDNSFGRRGGIVLCTRGRVWLSQEEIMVGRAGKCIERRERRFEIRMWC